MSFVVSPKGGKTTPSVSSSKKGLGLFDLTPEMFSLGAFVRMRPAFFIRTGYPLKIPNRSS